MAINLSNVAAETKSVVGYLLAHSLIMGAVCFALGQFVMLVFKV